MKKTDFKIAVFAGDGIGPEIMKEALKVLKVIAGKKNIAFHIHEAPTISAAFPCRIPA